MDINIAIRSGWALITDEKTGKTAVCVPYVTEAEMRFVLCGWHPDYAAAFSLIATMASEGVSVEDQRQVIEREAHGSQGEAPQ